LPAKSPDGVRRLSLAEFEAHADAFDALAAADPAIDGVCSSSWWILPFHAAFAPERELVLLACEAGFVALAATPRHLEPLERMWGFACPLVGPGAPDALAALAQGRVEAPRRPLVLSGLALERDWLESRLRPLRGWSVHPVDTTERRVASLEGGLDGFLARRPARLRQTLRAAERRARGAGLSFERQRPESADAAAAALDRALDVERRSWKGRSGVGVDRGPMRAFYAGVCARLARRHALRLVFARLDGRDVGYLHGGSLGARFRGLQMSFDAEHAALSLGNLLQLEAVRWLAGDGFECYDLGSARSAYKRRWAEREETTATLVCLPPRVREETP
jgi:CelD/BcsL family acetyltransferase involved in cellulose biosynthesis